MLDVVDGHSHRHPSRAAWLAAVAGSGRTGSSSKLGPRWEVAGRWAGRAAGESEKNSYRHVQHIAHRWSCDFLMALRRELLGGRLTLG